MSQKAEYNCQSGDFVQIIESFSYTQAAKEAIIIWENKSIKPKLGHVFVITDETGNDYVIDTQFLLQ